MSLTQAQCFEQLLLGKPVKSNGWLANIRREARGSAEALNFPSSAHDDWRFTDLSALFQHQFKPVDTFAKLSLSDIEKHFITDTIRMVFVDGCYAAALSDLSKVGAGLTVKSLLECFGDAQVEAHLGQHAPYQQDAFAAFNTHFFEDGAWIHVAKEVVTPIHLLHIATKRDTPSAIYPRGLMVLEANSRAVLIQDYVALEGAVYLTDVVTEIVLQQNAHLQHIHLQREEKSAFHVGQCDVKLAKGSVYTSTSLAFGARLSRYNLHVTQQGEGVEMHLNGLALIAGRQIADTHTLIDHAAPRGKSVQLHKCIADDAAQAVFSGKIMVHKHAAGTDSAQSSRNLLLSGKARIDTQPQLEIFNDDVSCKHGATVGQIDLDALFFLTSRGLTEADARNLLTHAFAAEIIEKIPVPALVATLSKTLFEREAKL
jgi:Fe-S cluster assembly protein SufD